MSLKDLNKLFLGTILVTNLIVYFAAVNSGALAMGELMAVATSWHETVPAAIMAIFTGILNAQLSSDAKARIVFLRWANPLPGSEAFTRHAATDCRIDLAALEREHGPLPSDHRQQNALWYKFYKSVEEDPSVVQVHREYLFTRDYACLALMLTVTLGTAGFIQIPSFKTAVVCLALLVIQLVLTLRAARIHGRQFVTTVLALKAAGR